MAYDFYTFSGPCIISPSWKLVRETFPLESRDRRGSTHSSSASFDAEESIRAAKNFLFRSLCSTYLTKRYSFESD